MQESPATAFRQQLESLYSISIEIARLHEMQQVFDRAGVLVNPDHAAGMSSSLKAGLASLASGVDRVVVMLGDQPDVRAPLLDQLLELQETSGMPAAALSFDGLLHRLWCSSANCGRTLCHCKVTWAAGGDQGSPGAGRPAAGRGKPETPDGYGHTRGLRADSRLLTLLL